MRVLAERANADECHAEEGGKNSMLDHSNDEMVVCEM
jgi:hypothetical protein